MATSDESIGTIDDTESIAVGQPLDRSLLRGVEAGILVTCTDSYCDWQGLFPSADLATEAVERHYDHERRSGEFHYGTRTYTVLALLDGQTATTLDSSQLGLTVEELRLGTTDGGVREVTFPRTTGDVADLVSRGDVIDGLVAGREGIVHSVKQTRSMGLPTWTVIYVDRDVDLADAHPKRDFYWINECIAHDGQVFERYGEDPLASPAFEVVDEAEHQAALSEFDV